MRKSSNSFRNSGTYTSPGTPDYRDNNNKGWYSERVPLPNNGSRSHISAAALMPFNSGRTMPSKWDDAERWITSPVSGFGVCKAVAAPPQRRLKSKSGPLGENPGVAYFSNYSPAVPVLEGGSTRNFIAGSPLTTGVLVPNGLSIHYGGGISAHSNPAFADYGVVRSSSSIPGWSELLIESSLPSSQDEKHDETDDAEDTISRVVSRRDIATQMSPVGSNASSPKGKLSLSMSPPSVPFTMDQGKSSSAKLEVRDVQVDKFPITRPSSKRHGVRKTKKQSPDVKELALTWETAEGAMRTSKLQKEEARITAWENLQNAKAEAAIQKLEMKLEKKRSASMDKILNKLRVAQMKAQDMRSSFMSESPSDQDLRNSSKVLSFRKFVRMHALNGCFTCHAS